MPELHIDIASLPLTFEGHTEERAFLNTRKRSRGQLRQSASGYILQLPGGIRHFPDMETARQHIYNQTAKTATQPLQSSVWHLSPHPIINNPAEATLTSPGTF